MPTQRPRVNASKWAVPPRLAEGDSPSARRAAKGTDEYGRSAAQRWLRGHGRRSQGAPIAVAQRPPTPAVPLENFPARRRSAGNRSKARSREGRCRYGHPGRKPVVMARQGSVMRASSAPADPHPEHRSMDASRRAGRTGQTRADGGTRSEPPDARAGARRRRPGRPHCGSARSLQGSARASRACRSGVGYLRCRPGIRLAGHRSRAPDRTEIPARHRRHDIAGTAAAAGPRRPKTRRLAPGIWAPGTLSGREIGRPGHWRPGDRPGPGIPAAETAPRPEI